MVGVEAPGAAKALARQGHEEMSGRNTRPTDRMPGSGFASTS
jgi:hypothetical protein